MQTKFRFNKKSIDLLPIPEKRQRVHDETVDGLILDLYPSGTKTFRIYKKIKGINKPVSVTLGKYPAISIENARKQGLVALNNLSQGVNPNERDRALRLAEKTLLEVFEDYVHFKELSSTTLRGYQSVVDVYLVAYQNRPIRALTEDIIKKEHRRITESSPAQADMTMRVVRALFNFARYEYRGVNNEFIYEHNPVGILSHQKAWNKVGRKNTRISRGQLPEWFDSLETIRQSGSGFAVSVCDLAEMAILTGLRRGELVNLTWNRVNLKEATYYIDTTKNGDPLELPLSNHLAKLLKRRHKNRGDSFYVFSSNRGGGRVIEPKKVLAQIQQLSGITFTLHDLRRTFTTTAESLGLGTYTIKRLLNHRTRRDDVTAGYMVLTPEELREPAQKIEDAILTQAGVLQPEFGVDQTLLELVTGMSEVEKRELIFALSKQKVSGDMNE